MRADLRFPLGAVARRGAFAAVLLLAAPTAWSGELIQFRAADGTIGFVDDASKLPPGARVVSRRASKPRQSDADEAPARWPFASEPWPSAAEDEAAPFEPSAERARDERCADYGLARGCSAQEAAAARRWCERAASVHAAREGAERSLERAEEAYEECNESAVLIYCSRRQIEWAERQLEDAEGSLEALEEQCRSAGCLPGWVREGCTR